MLIGLVCGVKEHLGTERKQSLSHTGASRPEALLCGLRIGRLGCSRGRELARVPCARRTVHFCGARSPEAGSAGKTETGAEGTLCPVRRPGSRPALSLGLRAGVLCSSPSTHSWHFLHGPFC